LRNLGARRTVSGRAGAGARLSARLREIVHGPPHRSHLPDELAEPALRPGRDLDQPGHAPLELAGLHKRTLRAAPDEVNRPIMTARDLRIGCAGLPPRMRRDTYFGRLDFLESDLLAQRPPPTAKALRAWRKALPEGGGFSLLASISGFTDEEATLAVDAALALAAEAVVFQTGPDVVPSVRDRQRLARWFSEQVPAERLGGAAPVWEPRGLWKPDEAANLAEELGAVLALDPLGHDPLDELSHAIAAAPATRYFRLVGLGRARRSYNAADLDKLEALCAGADRAWVVFAHVEKWRNATRFAERLA
jgi:uncharacterized protein YecE (DUF72 family)